MSKSSRLLDYAHLLHPTTPACGHSQAYILYGKVASGQITTLEEVHEHMQDHLLSNLVRTDGIAIKGIYTATAQQDGWKIALIDKMLYSQQSDHAKDANALSSSKLIKLAKALYPWIQFEEFEACLHRYKAVGTLATVHAWINFQLGVSLNEAVTGYLDAAVSSCVFNAARRLNIAPDKTRAMARQMLEEVESEWNIIRDLDPAEFQRTVAPHSISTTHMMLPLRRNTHMQTS